MDLGIAGRKAIVCASSKGLGRACARALAEAGCAVVLNGRDKETLDETARELRRATGVEVHEILGDLDHPATRAELIAACPDADILVNNNGGPPYKSFAEISREDVLKGIESNMLTPIALVQALAPGMAERKFGRIVNITSGSVRAPIAGLDVSSGARAGLDRVPRLGGEALRARQRDDQLDPARIVRNRPAEIRPRARGGAAERQRGYGARRFEGANPSRAIRRSGRVRRALRLSRQRACRIHHRSEHPHRRGRVPGGFLTRPGAARKAGAAPADSAREVSCPDCGVPFVSVAPPTAGRVATPNVVAGGGVPNLTVVRAPWYAMLGLSFRQKGAQDQQKEERHGMVHPRSS